MADPIPSHEGEKLRLPDRNLRVDYGEVRPGSSHPMPAETRAAYEERIRRSVEALAAGARLAGRLFVGSDRRS